MRYISEYSARGLVNILAEKISNKLSENEKYTSSIEVIDCINFYVVKGYTSNNTVLDFSIFKNEFMNEEKEYLEKLGKKTFNFIDVIEYSREVDLGDLTYWFEFYNSKRPLYNTTVINLIEKNELLEGNFESIVFNSLPMIETLFPLNYNELQVPNLVSPITISSHFPFGYSLKCGKTKLYYCEYICNQLFSILNTDKILFKISNRINENGDLDIEIISNSQYDDLDIKSMVLDIFDFNLTKFQTDYLKDYDFIQEIRKPLEIKAWINKDKVRELMIV